MGGLRRFVVSAAFLLANAGAHACTVCDSHNGVALRAGLFNGQFLHTLLLVLAPVPVFAAAVALLHFGLPDLAGTAEAKQQVPATHEAGRATLETGRATLEAGRATLEAEAAW